MIKVKFTLLGDRIEKSKIALQRALLVPGLSRFEFGYQPDVYYEGIVAGTTDYNLITFRYSEGSFEIHCFNPFAISKRRLQEGNRTSLSSTTKGLPLFILFINLLQGKHTR